MTRLSREDGMLPKYNVGDSNREEYERLERILTYNGKSVKRTPLSIELDRLVRLRRKTPLMRHLSNGISSLEDSLVRKMLVGDRSIEEGSIEWSVAKASFSTAAEEHRDTRDLGTPYLIHSFLMSRAAMIYGLGLTAGVIGLIHDIGEQVTQTERSSLSPDEIMVAVAERISGKVEGHANSEDRILKSGDWDTIIEILDDAAMVSAGLTRELREPYQTYLVAAIHEYFQQKDGTKKKVFNPELAYLAAMMKQLDRIYNTLDLDPVGEESRIDPKKRFKILAKNVLLENEARVLRQRKDFRISNEDGDKMTLFGLANLYFTELEARRWMECLKPRLPDQYVNQVDLWINAFERTDGFENRTRRRPPALVRREPWLRFHGKINYVLAHFRGENNLEQLSNKRELYEFIYTIRRFTQLMYLEPHKVTENLTHDSGGVRRTRR